MKYLSIIVISILSLFCVAGLQANVDVAMPDTSAFSGDTLLVPVRVSDLSGLEIYSYQFDLFYDPEVIEAIGVDSSGTLTQIWGSAVINLETPGVMKLGNYGTTALSNAGVLVYLKFTLIGEMNDSTQLDVEAFAFNDVNPAAVVSDGSVKILPPLISVTFELNVLENLEFFVDGVKKNFPFDTTWSAGTSHTISTSTPQFLTENIRYIFQQWSDGKELSHEISPQNDTTFILYMQKEYLLTVNSAYGDALGGGWYAEDSSATFSADSLVHFGDSTRFVFNGWEGVGPGAYTGMERTNTITIMGPVIETAKWQTQYFLEIESPFGSPVGEGWHDESATVSIGIDSVVSLVEGTRYVFTEWLGIGESSYTGNERITEVIVSNPVKQIANWDTEYFFELKTSPAGLKNFENSGWYLKNTVVTGDTAHDVIHKPDSVFRFQAWELDGEQVAMNPVTTMMDTSHSAVAVYGVDSVRVSITSDIADDIFISVNEEKKSLPYDDFWAYGAEHVIGVDSLQFSSDSTTRYLFESWSDGGAKVHSITADSALSLRLNLMPEFYLSVDTYPPGLFDYQEKGWYPQGTSVQLPEAEAVIFAAQDTFHFKGWQVDGLPQAGNPINVTMDRPHEVIALYEDLYSITGTVFDTRNNPLPGVTLFLSGEKADTVATVSSGNFNFNYLGSGSYRVTPFLEGFQFEPLFREYSSLNQIVQNQNFIGTDIEEPTVQLHFPNGGEEFQSAKTDSILWSVTDNVGIDSILIYLSLNNGSTWQRIAAFSSGNQERYMWSIPDVNSATCKIMVRAMDFDGNEATDQSDNVFTIIGSARVEMNFDSNLPSKFTVEQNYPNPFNNATMIPFQIPQKSHVRICIFNTMGQEILRLLDQEVMSGTYRILWDGKDANGREMSSGIYFYRVEACGQVLTRRLLYLR